MTTIVDRFWANVDALGNRPALRHRDQGGAWQPISWASFGGLVSSCAAWLQESGVAPGDRIGILSQNRYEWHVADLAIMSVGAVTVPIYPTSAPSQVRWLVEHSGMACCFAEDREQLEKLRGQNSGRAVRAVLFDTVERSDSVLPFADVLSAGDVLEARRRDSRMRPHPSDLATIVYTSGTTGTPKGVLITHGNITASIEQIRKVVPLGEGDRFLSFLPLSHIAERVVSNFGQIAAGGETWFAQSFSTVAHDLRDCRPTFFVAVPRVWQKFRDVIGDELRDAGPLRRTLIGQYRRAAVRVIAPTSTPLAALDRLVFASLDKVVGSAVRKKTGLDHARLLVSTAAPIDGQLLAWLAGVGLRVSEAYGQTEACGPTTLTPAGRERFGTVGPPLPGVELRFAEDDEILVRGPNVCTGYYRDPVATEALFDRDGFLRTGDLGRLDADGYLQVTGRKKDLMKTAQGKYVAPQEIETRLEAQRFILQAVVVGEGRPYVTALLTLDLDALAPWARALDKPLAIEELAHDPDVLREIEAAVGKVNAELNHAEQVKRWRLISRELSIDEGELTPTLKVVRRAVLAHFPELVDDLYVR